MELTLKVARAVGIKENEIPHIRRGALLHDIGKMGIPNEILHKPDKLTAEEWEIMKKHPVIGRNLLAHISFLEKALEIPSYHHERWDGQGYPDGLKGEEIPPAARIFAVVDHWDALLSDRPYRKAWEQERVVGYLQEQSGLIFDPHITRVFLLIVQGEV
jgi:HD-GYP domain-containing protein (c-di-GMP phosphodiesterase class II)